MRTFLATFHATGTLNWMAQAMSSRVTLTPAVQLQRAALHYPKWPLCSVFITSCCWSTVKKLGRQSQNIDLDGVEHFYQLKSTVGKGPVSRIFLFNSLSGLHGRQNGEYFKDGLNGEYSLKRNLWRQKRHPGRLWLGEEVQQHVITASLHSTSS